MASRANGLPDTLGSMKLDRLCHVSLLRAVAMPPCDKIILERGGVSRCSLQNTFTIWFSALLGIIVCYLNSF